MSANYWGQEPLPDLQAEPLARNERLDAIVATLHKTCEGYEERLMIAEPLVDDLRQENERLRSALRAYAISAQPGFSTYCDMCDAMWNPSGHEEHAAGCLASPTTEVSHE